MGNLLFSPSGRISHSQLIKGALIVSALLFVIKALPLVSVPVAGIAAIIGLVLIYCWVALFIKRAHDAGKSGWLSIIPVLLIVLVGMFVIEPLMQGMFAGDEMAAVQNMAAEAAEAGDFGAIMSAATGPEATALAKAAALPVAAGRFIFSMLVAFLFSLLMKSDPGDNQYGPATPMG